MTKARDVTKLTQKQDTLYRIMTSTDPDVPVFYGYNITGEFSEILRNCSCDKVIFIADKTAFQLHGVPLLRAIQSIGISAFLLELSAGESEKTISTLSKICEFALEHHVTNDSILLGFGGGMVTNIAGLAASLLYRGISYIEVPTTFLGQTDSTFSNKQAVNSSHGKNQIGTYYAPIFIWCDLAYTATEQKRQWNAAIVEGIKNALLTEETLPDDFLHIAGVSSEQMLSLFHRITESKRKILQRDPTERNYAVILEYGHTFGHAIEFLSQGEVNHGEAVAVGMCMAAHASEALGLLSLEDVERHYRLLAPFFPENLTRLFLGEPAEEIHARIQFDNKRNQSGIPFVLLSNKCSGNGERESVIKYLSEGQIQNAISAFFHQYQKGNEGRHDEAGSANHRFS